MGASERRPGWILLTWIGLLVAAVTALLLLRFEDPTAAPPPTDFPSRTRPELARPATPVVSAPTTRVATRVETAYAVFRGRCVDQSGRPLPGAIVDLKGRPDRMRSIEWRRNHDEVHWQDIQRRTDTDGRFILEFDPPPPWNFSLIIHREDTIYVANHWLDSIKPGTDLDLGDIVVARGVRVHGHVVDARGQAITLPPDFGARVHLRKIDPFPGRVTPTDRVGATILPDGSFEFVPRIAPGRWRVSVDGVTGTSFVAEVSGNEHVLHVPIDPLGRHLVICGEVVDNSGQPVASARIEPLYRKTDGAGRFALFGRPSTNPDVGQRLAVKAKGYLPWQSERPVVWGTNDLRIVLRPSATVRLQLVSSRGRPIDTYRVHVNRESMANGVHVGGWRHPRGIETIGDVRPGPAELRIEPGEPGRFPTIRRSVEFADGAVLRIRCPDRIRQPVRVIDSNGRGIAGSRIEWIDAGKRRIGPFTSVMRPRTMSSDRPRLCQSVETDEDGRATLAGDPEPNRVLRVIGEHAPIVHTDHRLSNRELTLIAATGARLVVRIQPASVVGQWFANVSEYRGPRPTLLVQAASDGNGPGERWSPEINLERNGTATVSDLPTGSAVVSFRYADAGHQGHHVSNQVFQLHAGRTTEVTIDLTHLADFPIAGSVRLGSTMPKTGSISFQREQTTAGGYANLSLHQGRFRGRLRAGTWRATYFGPLAGRHVPVLLSPLIRVSARSQASSLDLLGRVIRPRFRVLEPDGSPGAGLEIRVEQKKLRFSDSVHTNQVGEFEFACGEGPLELATNIRSHQDPNERKRQIAAIRQQFAGDAGAIQSAIMATTLQIAEFAPESLRSLERSGSIEIRLPPEWDR